MMKFIILFISIVFLTSCHINDPRPENHRAKVSVAGGRVCITAPGAQGERITSLSINEIGNSGNMIARTFTIDNAPVLFSDKCISDAGFTFAPGKSYIFSVNAIRIKENHTIENGNSYSVTFSVWKDNGKLKVKDIN
ncbi:putative T6SS immunity periplasmic lipoprotein [Tatumella sp. UCD-D_suzukii]|uniref:putative T6SS immunity periplasmic lipoprotein n=1 Tax=Tatumella sp. UCD-D_suzukii TaxID=1408192 RepID=UPI00046EC0B7|nr:putative T6SS immunity periplasmic lipoprotein [Tatumella sp. UCD-D_suzukii]